jgi:hypothetical protein
MPIEWMGKGELMNRVMDGERTIQLGEEERRMASVSVE